MTILDLDIPGLSMVLAGGVRVLERMPGAGESAALLIRGPAGSGKTVFGTQLAASIARKLNTDVAYGCIELLPTELKAQHEGVRRPTTLEQVVVLGHQDSAQAPGNDYVRIYAGILDIEDSEHAVSRLGDALDALLSKATKEAGRKVGVFVVDSLSDGYGLGATKAPRILADAVCKLAAASGLVAVLLEETADDKPSVWSFAVDTVFELAPAERGSPFERLLSIPKNRLGPADPGPHRFNVQPGNSVEIYPREFTYKSPWAVEQLRHSKGTSPSERPWSPHILANLKWLPNFNQSTVSVSGRDPSAILNLAARIGIEKYDTTKTYPNINILWNLGKFSENSVERAKLESLSSLPLSTTQLIQIPIEPTTSGAKLLHNFLKIINSVKRPINRIVIGDLRQLQFFADPEGTRWAITIAVSLMRALQIPVVLFETNNDSNLPRFAYSIADVALIYEELPTGSTLSVENTLTGVQGSFEGTLDDLVWEKAP